MEIDQNPKQDHWDFSLALYGRPGVEEACLALQDNIALNVNVLLVGLYWAGALRRIFEPQHLHAADAEIAPWRRDIVHPLRALRVGLKNGPPPAPRPDTETLRQMIKNAELQAERTAQQTLSAWFARLALSPGTEPITHAMVMTALNAVDYYLSKTAAVTHNIHGAPSESLQEANNDQLMGLKKPHNQNLRAAAELIAREAVNVYTYNTP